ncbi:MAG: cytochrome c [Alphaproteobacteria bacterium]
MTRIWNGRRNAVYGVLAIAGLLSIAQASFAAGRSETEELVAQLGCPQCHGAAGISSDPAIPSLAGQKYDYLLRQISVFRQTYIAGPDRVPVTTRAHPVMSRLSREMTPDQMQDIARHYSLLSCGPAPTVSPPPGAAPAGVDRCEVCHGGKRTNPWRDTPYISAQSETYLYRTIRGLAGAIQTPEAPHERYHRLSEIMFDSDPDTILRAYAAYYAHLSCTPR